jgi:hypothetical protein
MKLLNIDMTEGGTDYCWVDDGRGGRLRGMQ